MVLLNFKKKYFLQYQLWFAYENRFYWMDKKHVVLTIQHAIYGSFSKNGGIWLSKIEKLSKIQHKLYCAYKIIYILDYKNQEKFDLN